MRKEYDCKSGKRASSGCGKDHSRQKVRDPDGLAPNQVDTHAEDQDIAHHRQIHQRRIGHNRLDHQGQGGDASLEDSHGDGGENAALAHRAGHHQNDDKVQHGFGSQDGKVTGKTVFNSAYNGHSANADGERGSDEAVHKPRILAVAGLVFQPKAEPLKKLFNIQDLANQGAQRQATDDQQRLPADQLTTLDLHHTLQSAGNGDEDHLLECIRMGCIPTHHTSQAISAAAAYGFALRAALDGKEMAEILEAAERGAKRGYESMDYVAAAPDCISRLKKIMEDLKEDSSDARIRHLLYYVYGNGLESIDAFAVTMTVFMAKGKDVYGALKLCASLGGDTDTVGALAGAICAAYAGGHNIPDEVLKTVIENNHLDIDEVVEKIETTFWQ